MVSFSIRRAPADAERQPHACEFEREMTMKPNAVYVAASSLCFVLFSTTQPQRMNTQQSVHITQERSEAGEKAARQVIKDFSEERMYSNSDLRLMYAYREASLAASVNQVAHSLTSTRANPEAIEAYRVVLAFNEAGIKPNYLGISEWSGDLGKVRAALVMLDALNVLEKAASPTSAAYTRISQVARSLMNKERIQEAKEASYHVAVAFGETGTDEGFRSSDLGTIKAFQRAFVATDVLGKATISAYTRNVDKDLLQKAVEASKRFLATFNEKGKDASFYSEDKDTLKAFQKALAGSK